MQVQEEYQLFSIQEEGTGNHTKIIVTINGKLVTMKIDNGSAVSMILDSVLSFFETATLLKIEAKLCTYSGEQLPAKGKITFVKSFTKGKPVIYHLWC